MKGKFLRIICAVTLSLTLVLPSSFGAGANGFAEHFNAGQNFLNQAQYSSAIVEFRKALRINYLDNSARIGIINSYLARATYYANQDKNYEKAANDFRSALFYLKIYPNKEQIVQNSAGMINSAMENLKQCLHVTSFDTTPSSRYKKAEELRALGDLSAAAYEFSVAAQNEKFTSQSYENIADLLKNLGNETRSIDYYKLALDSNPSNGSLRMKYARTLDKVGVYDEALPQYNAALANAKGDAEVLYALERIYLKKLAQTPRDAELNANLGAIKQAQGDFESALDYYGKAEQINPNNVTTRLNVGTLYQQKKDYQRALTAYESVLTLYPNNTQALMYKAQVLSEMGDKATALNLYKKVLSLDAGNKEARAQVTNLVKATMNSQELIAYLASNGEISELYEYSYKLHKDNNIDDAILGYRAVIQKDDKNVNAYVNLAACYASKDDYNSAISVLTTAKEKFPTNEMVINTLKDVQKDSVSTKLATASQYYENKDYKKAIADYMKINPPTETSLIGIAASYQALEDYDNAIEYYKKAEQIAAKNSEIPYYIGYLYMLKKDWSSAEIYLKKSVALNPNSEAKDLLENVSNNSALATLNEGIDFFEKNDYANALSKFNSVLKQDSKNTYAYYYRGLIYDEQKNQKLAIADYLNVLKYSQEFPIVNYMLAVDYDALANYKEAVKYFSEFIAKYSTDDEYLKYAKTRIEELKPYAG